MLACRRRSRPRSARGLRQERIRSLPRSARASGAPSKRAPVTEVFVAPIAFMTPISTRRSRMAAADVAATAKPAAISAASVTIHSSVLTRERMRPSVSATRRIARTSRPGQHLLDLVADRGNVGRAEPAVVFRGRQRFRIAFRERVGGLGQRAHERAAGIGPG